MGEKDRRTLKSTTRLHERRGLTNKWRRVICKRGKRERMWERERLWKGLWKGKSIQL